MWADWIFKILVLFTSLKPTRSQHNFQTDPTHGSGAGRAESVDSMHARHGLRLPDASLHVAWHTPDTCAVSEAPGGHVSAVCVSFTKKHIWLYSNQASPWRDLYQKDGKLNFLKTKQFTFSAFLNHGIQLLLSNYLLFFFFFLMG